MSQFTWTNPGSYWRARSDLVSWSLPFNPNLQGGGAEPFYQLDWPNPPLGSPVLRHAPNLLTHLNRLVPLTVWNPNDKSANVTLSNGNLTAAGTATGMVRATTSVAAAKWFFSFTSSVSTGGAVRIGIANAGASLASVLGNVAGGLSYRQTDGKILLEGAVVATLAIWAIGDVVDVALDETNQKIWFRVNNGNWNNDTLANQNPASNVGGVDISTLSGPHFPAMSVGGGGAGATGTANFGVAIFPYPIPAGFHGFDGDGVAAQGPSFLPMVDLAPRGFVPALSLRTHIDATRIQLIGQDQFFGLAGHPGFDWPNPRGYVPATSLRTHLDGARVTLFGQDTIYGAPGQGVPNYDWPNPRAPGRAVDLFSWSDGSRIALTAAPAVPLPFLPSIDLAPRGYAYPVSLRTHLDGARVTLFGQDTIYGAPGQGVPNYDWPNPRGYMPGIALRSWSQSLLQGTLAPFIQRQSDWPNPRGYVHAISLRTHLDPLKLTLRGQDTIYGAPGQGVPNYDWPNPRGYVHAISLRSWSQNLLQSTIAPIAQRPGSQTDWPNPRGYAYPVSLRTTLNPRILPPPIDWVTPPDAAGIWVTQGDASSGTWTTQSAAAGFWTTQPDAT